MAILTNDVTVLLVPGLRDHVDEHWQTLLANRLVHVHSVPPMGRENLDCAQRVAAIERAAGAIAGPIVLIAHSGGCIMVAHWARTTAHAARIRGCLLATPPDFEQPMPPGYPTIEMLRAGGWLPVPCERLPFRSLVALSQNDPLGACDRVLELADDWGSETLDLGQVGHLNPASGYGDWPLADTLIQQLSRPNVPI